MQDGRTGLLDQKLRVAGPGAAAIKYDILTALLVTAAQGDAVEARLALRLSLLITARFNWRSGSFSVGLKELARMWGVTERTAKREMAAMRGRGWIVVDVPAARGRVARYRIEIPAVLRMTVPHWAAVGPDFVARMSDVPEPVPGADNVVPLRTSVADMPAEDGTGWAGAARLLQAQDPAIYRAWFTGLTPVDLESGVLTLNAPSRFVANYVTTHHMTRLMAALLSAGSPIHSVQVVS